MDLMKLPPRGKMVYPDNESFKKSFDEIFHKHILTEVELIRKIIKFHPVLEAGIKRGWSMWRKGAYGGEGRWNYLKLINATWTELSFCLEELKLENEVFNLEWEE